MGILRIRHVKAPGFSLPGCTYTHTSIKLFRKKAKLLVRTISRMNSFNSLQCRTLYQRRQRMMKSTFMHAKFNLFPISPDSFDIDASLFHDGALSSNRFPVVRSVGYLCAPFVGAHFQFFGAKVKRYRTRRRSHAYAMDDGSDRCISGSYSRH